MTSLQINHIFDKFSCLTRDGKARWYLDVFGSTAEWYGQRGLLIKVRLDGLTSLKMRDLLTVDMALRCVVREEYV